MTAKPTPQHNQAISGAYASCEATPVPTPRTVDVGPVLLGNRPVWTRRVVRWQTGGNRLLAARQAIEITRAEAACYLSTWRIAPFGRFWQARHPPRYAAFIQPSSPRFPHSSNKEPAHDAGADFALSSFAQLATSGHLMRSHQQQLRPHTPNSLGVVACRRPGLAPIHLDALQQVSEITLKNGSSRNMNHLEFTADNELLACH